MENGARQHQQRNETGAAMIQTATMSVGGGTVRYSGNQDMLLVLRTFHCLSFYD